MGSFRCYDSSNVIATLMMTNFHLNTTDVAIFPNVCLWRRSLCSDLTMKNCIEPPSYSRTAYVVAIWPSFVFDSFVIIWATCEIFLGKWVKAPPPLAKNFPYAYGVLSGECDQISVGQFYVFYERLLFMQGCRYDYKLPGKFS